MMTSSAAALERLRVRVGPISQTLELSDLEAFARTGEVPTGLQIYSALLTPEVRAMLQNRLALDPAVSDRIIEDILDSPNGELLLDTLASIAPMSRWNNCGKPFKTLPKMRMGLMCWRCCAKFRKRQ